MDITICGIRDHGGNCGRVDGVLFLIPYTKLNPDDRSAYPYVFGGLLLVVEIVVSEFISLAIVAAAYEIDLGAALALPDVTQAMVLDIVLGLILSAVCFVGYVLMLRNQNKKVGRRRTDATRTDTTPKDDTSDASVEPFDNVTSDDAKKDDTTDSGWKME